MIHTCELCGQDFLTEADCYVVRPTPKGIKLYCYCQIRGFEEMQVLEKLQAENAKLRDCVEFYAELLHFGKRARQVLKELEEK